MDSEYQLQELHAINAALVREIASLTAQLAKCREATVEECAKKAEATEVGYSALHGRQRIATAIRALATGERHG